MQKIYIIGTSGSGKSWLSAQLGDLYQLPVTDLDELYWQPNWQPLPEDQMRKKVEDFADQEKWVTSGNYSQFSKPLWQHADAVVWVDYPFHVIFRRLLRRSIERAWSKEDLWYQGSGCKESFVTTFASKDSIMMWMFKTYWKNKKRYINLFYQKEMPDRPKLIHLTNYKDPMGEWSEKLGEKAR